MAASTRKPATTISRIRMRRRLRRLSRRSALTRSARDARTSGVPIVTVAGHGAAILIAAWLFPACRMYDLAAMGTSPTKSVLAIHYCRTARAGSPQPERPPSPGPLLRRERHGQNQQGDRAARAGTARLLDAGAGADLRVGAGGVADVGRRVAGGVRALRLRHQGADRLHARPEGRRAHPQRSPDSDRRSHRCRPTAGRATR